MAESKKATIDPTWTIVTFHKTDKDFPAILFEVYGVAFADLVSQTIILNGDEIQNPDQVLAIEAHEIAHGRLNHAVREIDSVTQEKEADWLAHKMLTEMNLIIPARIIAERYSNYYAEDISSQNERMVEILRSAGF